MESKKTIKTFICLLILLSFSIMQISFSNACEISTEENIINNGKAKPNGVPNYDMADYGNNNNCGPTTATLLLGYYDANDWPCMIDGEPYIDYGDSNEIGVRSAYYYVSQAIAFDPDTGTWTGGTLTPHIPGSVGEGVVNAACSIGDGCNWDYDDDEAVFKSEIKNEIKKKRPVMLLTRINGIDVTWYDDDFDADGTGENINLHWMPILGYKNVVEGSTVFIFGIGSYCSDWLNPDEFYLTLRSAWRRGGDSKIVYNWSVLDNLYTVSIIPNGTNSCSDYSLDADNDGFYAQNAPVGTTPGTDCDDSVYTTHPGAVELCNNLDDDCDGDIDEGINDMDNDGIQDTCDDDRDGDGKLNSIDNCPDDINPSQSDLDSDGKGDLCDSDRDGDSKYNWTDNCPDKYNYNQNDIDNDGRGDICDGDKDGDGFHNTIDNCPDISNSHLFYNSTNPDGIMPPEWEGRPNHTYYQKDSDRDGLGNECDNCIFASNPNQDDLDKDGKGDLCDNDKDGDGIKNDVDQCPEDSKNLCVPKKPSFSFTSFSFNFKFRWF